MNVLSLNSPFMRGVNKLVMMLYVGILWFICSIPVITAGAATAAMYEVLLKAAKNQEGYIASSFFKAFRGNLKQGILAWLPVLAAWILFSVNLFYYGVLGGKDFILQTVLFAVLLFLDLAVFSYVFPVMARFENTVRGHFRMAVTLALRNPGWTIVMAVLWLLTLFLTWFLVYFPILFIVGIVGYAQAVICNHIFDGLIDKRLIVEEGGADDAEQGNTESGCDISGT